MHVKPLLLQPSCQRTPLRRHATTGRETECNDLCSERVTLPDIWVDLHLCVEINRLYWCSRIGRRKFALEKVWAPAKGENSYSTV